MKYKYYTIKQLAEMLGVPQRTLQYVLIKRNRWDRYLERIGYNGKKKSYFIDLFEINRDNAKIRKENARQEREHKMIGKFGGASKDSPNVIARKKKEEELRQINERIEQLEEKMAAVVFDRDINSQLQSLYIKRRFVREFLGIKDYGIIEECYL